MQMLENIRSKQKDFLPSNFVCCFRKSNASQVATEFLSCAEYVFRKSMTFTFLLHQIKLETALHVTAAFSTMLTGYCRHKKN